MRKLIVVWCGVVVGCGSAVKPGGEVVTEEAVATETEALTVEFDGRVWTATEERAWIAAVVMLGQVYRDDQPGERLVVGFDETARGSAAKVAVQLQRQFGSEWLADGLTELFSADGVRESSRYLKGDRFGEQWRFYADGTPARMATVRGDKLHGPWKSWFENGQLWEEAVYMDGVRMTGRVWREDGTELE